MRIKFTLPGKPVAQGRPRFYRKGKFVVATDPKPSKVYKADIASPFNETHRGTGRSDEDIDNVVKSKRNIGISILCINKLFFLNNITWIDM